jgi:ABC-2 type transport system ATP-binding protein
MSEKTAVHVENVTKNYGSFCAVDQVSFDVNYGEIFAMLGPNGAGKSTTIRMLLDILKPDSGTIRLFGAPITAEAKDRIGYLPEERGLYGDVKVVEMMVYLGTLKGMSNKQARDKAMQLLERLELADRAEKKSKELSKGMQQKVQFAVTVMHEPELIIVDEPFSGLDPLNTLVIKDLILELKAAGTAIIMSTHQMHQIEEMADRLFMISRGREALYGPVDEVRSRYAPHAVIVEGTGDYSILQGVERVEVDRNRRKASLLYMEPDVTPNDVLASIAASPDVLVDRFERAVPSLNDIFIQVAGESAYEDQRVEDQTKETPSPAAANA